MVATYCGLIAAAWLTAWYASQNLVRADSYARPAATLGGAWTEGWLRWDAVWYLHIARNGYSYQPGSPSSVVYLPGYPLVIRAVGWVVGDLLVAGLLVTAVSGALAAFVLWHWFGSLLSSAEARRTAIVLVLVWPWAYHLYATVYAEALFLALAVAAFVMLERGHLLLAAGLGAAATATRPVGVAVAVGLALRLVERRGGLRSVRVRDATVLLSFGGIGGYCTYLWVRFGDPLIFLSGQSAPGWEQELSLRNLLKVPLLDDIVSGSKVLPVRMLMVVGVLTLAAIALLPRVWKRFGMGYGAYTAIVVLMPAIGSKDFQGMGRYLLLAFPLFALVGEWLAARREVIRRLVIGVSFAVLVSFTALFATGHYLS